MQIVLMAHTRQIDNQDWKMRAVTNLYLPEIRATREVGREWLCFAFLHMRRAESDLRFGIVLNLRGGLGEGATQFAEA